MNALLPEVDLRLDRLRELYLRREAQPSEVLAQVLMARDASDPAIWIDRLPHDEVLARAARLDQVRDVAALPLYGVPIAVKDNIDVAGRPTTAACPSYARTPERSATAVSLLEAAGAVVIGKTNLDQFATGLVGTRSPYGTPTNPLAPDHVPGGSSSGSAVAVARGLVSLALGTDTAGSGRVPAALNGIVGCKPTPGRVSTAGVVPACASLDTVSVFARSVEEGMTALGILDVHDAMDPWSIGPSERTSLAPHIPAVRVGVPDSATLSVLDPTALDAFTTFLAHLADTGLEPVAVDLQPFLEVSELLYDGPWVAERLVHLEEVLDTSHDVDPTVRGILEAARTIRAVDVFRGLERLQILKHDVARTFAEVPLLVLPSVPTFPTLAEVAADPLGPNHRLGTFTNFVNLLALSAVAVPTGTRSDGLPVGITVVGPAGTDKDVATVAAQVATPT